MRPSPRKKYSDRCCRCCAIATTTTRCGSRTTRNTGFPVRCGEQTWTVRSRWLAGCEPGRSRSTVLVPAVRRLAASTRVGSVEREAGLSEFVSTWSRKPWDCRRDARRRRRCRRSRDCRVEHVTAALDGLRVIEIANEISGPYCGKLFVDLGAEVTKIEAPGGDSLRRWGPFPGGQADPDRCGLFE